MAQYNPFMLKVPLYTNQPTNRQDENRNANVT